MLVIGTPLATKSKSKRREKIHRKQSQKGIQRDSSRVIQHKGKEYSTLWQALKAMPFRRVKNLRKPSYTKKTFDNQPKINNSKCLKYPN